MYQGIIQLSNGLSVPRLALGTYLIPESETAEAVKSAIELGYRHIDTAQAYENEHGVGEGVRAGAVPREELFITSKVLAEIKDRDLAARSIDESLRTSGLDYFDLMLIHCPQPWAEYGSEYRYFEENRAVWKALEDAYRVGKVRSIGVSNFSIEDLKSLAVTAEIKPMVNQISLYAGHTDLDLIAYCQENGIVVEAYSPLGHGEVFKNKALLPYAEKYRVSVAQLCIRYTLQLDAISLPKTTSPERMRLNASLDFAISDKDMEELKRLIW